MRIWLLAIAALAVLAAVFFERPHATPGPPMRDFEAYYAAGSTWNHGGDPYSQAIWPAEQPLPGVNSQRYEALPFVGPPMLLPVFAVIARMPFLTANVFWRALLIAALAVVAFVTLRMAGNRFTAVSILAISVAALGFGPLTSALALGQIALPAFACALLSLAWAPASFLAWMQPNIALTLASQVRSRRVFAFAIAALAFGAACVAVGGIGGIQHYVAVLQQHAFAERFSAIQITPASIAYGFGASEQLASAIGTVVTLAAVCCWAMLMRERTDALTRFCSACALLPLAMPFFHEHDLLVAFVPAVVLTVRADARTWPIAAFGGLLAATDWLGLAQRPDGALQTLLLVGAFGLALVALREQTHPRMLIVPGVALAAIAVATAFAHAHAAPVWPDAMGAVPPRIGHADIAAAWNAQQRATGLLAQDPVWAALRCLSLAGCALIAVATAISSRYFARSRNPLPDPA